MLQRLALLVCLILPAAVAEAQTFPDRPIRIIVPINPGGGTDIFARKLAELAAPELGQPVVVENRPGGSGTIGVQHVVDARPDGYTLGFLLNTPVTAAPHTLGTRYGPESFTSILSVGHSAYTLCAQPGFPANTLQEFIAAIRARPGEYTWGNEGLGGAMHLGVERILRRLDLSMTTVPFQGAGQTLPAFLGGHITFYGGSVVGAMPAVRAGTAKCLLLTTAEDHPALPAASGLGSLGLADHAITIWWGLFAPNGIPADRLDRIAATFLKAARSEAFGQVVESQGATWRVEEGPAMAAQIRAEHAALGGVARDLGLAKPSR
ncbi:tripartite tricarboxylate transporter substrate binding protein [Belnapia sp. T6]|uniref:Tripartite tricarboxylate transporter substrate binding protein n=1 Tax=Belnapia mucosa TaxID=2804532 RepID=A0ABS1UXJ7_9PROT|nr:tripartite tricarboxylate transporter substrate binding protein [Belnapia mucosa]MBL6454198.1 tripartite tricarboxylate transporter substrate binding protein [Belnapia mucosa]